MYKTIIAIYRNFLELCYRESFIMDFRIAQFELLSFTIEVEFLFISIVGN